jgi:hypothetical protein
MRKIKMIKIKMIIILIKIPPTKMTKPLQTPNKPFPKNPPHKIPNLLNPIP